MTLPADALAVLERTSRTFYIPISALPDRLREAVASGYLCMRAIDEIEDHPTLDPKIKARELVAISDLFQAQTTVEDFAHDEFAAIFAGHEDEQPEVTTRIGEWACLAPDFIAPRIWEATAGMASRMARWVTDDWRVETEADLDRYTYAVAGAVGLLVCDIGAWYDGAQMHRSHALHFGRGLQSVNILRNRKVDLARGVDFYPNGWTDEDMDRYARRNLRLADEYARTLPPGPFGYFIQIPLALATATLDTMAEGEEKLSREAVQELVARLSQP
ncbi:MAG TPA: phytoene/squalene synthase family protein [Ktedonobacterales bacterium]|jgi:farnesyl-diphosphate farnesyltransferase|nr:phytoene/squalene synthase family protein [Ktedonobacterales bacterium]